MLGVVNGVNENMRMGRGGVDRSVMDRGGVDRLGTKVRWSWGWGEVGWTEGGQR